MAVSVEGGQATASGATLDASRDLSTLLEETRVALLRRYGEQPQDTVSTLEPSAEQQPFRGA